MGLKRLGRGGKRRQRGRKRARVGIAAREKKVRKKGTLSVSSLPPDLHFGILRSFLCPQIKPLQLVQ